MNEYKRGTHYEGMRTNVRTRMCGFLELVVLLISFPPITRFITHRFPYPRTESPPAPPTLCWRLAMMDFALSTCFSAPAVVW